MITDDYRSYSYASTSYGEIQSFYHAEWGTALESPDDDFHSFDLFLLRFTVPCFKESL